MNIELRSVLVIEHYWYEDGTQHQTEHAQQLQYRTCEVYPHWSEWWDVPTVVQHHHKGAIPVDYKKAEKRVVPV